MATEFFTQDNGGAASNDITNKMFCSVCFDVEAEDGEVEEGTDGVGACFYADTDTFYYDADYFGRIEAAGANSFMFREAEKNNWD